MNMQSDTAPRSEGRLFYDLTGWDTLDFDVPNKFTRILDGFIRNFEELQLIEICADGFLERKLAISDDDVPTIEPPQIASDLRQKLARVDWWKVRLKLSILAALSRLPLFERWRKWVRHTGAFTLSECHCFLDSRQRHHFRKRFDVVSGHEQHRRFKEWLRKASARRVGDAGKAFAPNSNDCVILCSPIGSLPRLHLLCALKDRFGFSICAIVPDVGCFLSPPALNPRMQKRYATNLRLLLGVARSLLLPSDHARLTLLAYCERWQWPAPPMDLFTSNIETSLTRSASKGLIDSRADDVDFVLTFYDLSHRTNIWWLLDLWQRAGTSIPDLPKLVIINRAPDAYFDSVLGTATDILGKIEVVTGPSDHVLGSLIREAKAILRAPSSGGYGLEITEAIAMGRTCLCEDHADFAHVKSAKLRRLALDMPTWIDALRSALEERHTENPRSENSDQDAWNDVRRLLTSPALRRVVSRP